MDYKKRPTKRLSEKRGVFEKFFKKLGKLGKRKCKNVKNFILKYLLSLLLFYF